MHWYLEVLKKYTLFTGRARRSEYWYFVLLSIVIAVVLAMVDSVVRKITGIGFGLFGTLYSLAVLVPGIAVSIRRLHDTDRSGWWLLLGAGSARRARAARFHGAGQHGRHEPVWAESQTGYRVAVRGWAARPGRRATAPI